MQGVQEYDDDKKPICPLCRKSFHRLMSHVRQAHGLMSQEYKKQYGFCAGSSFISQASKEKARIKVLKNPKIIYNLTKNGMKTRFVKGHSINKGNMTPERRIKIAQNRAKANPSAFMKKVWEIYKKDGSK